MTTGSTPFIVGVLFMVWGCLGVLVNLRTRLVITDDSVSIYPMLGAKTTLPRSFCISGAAVRAGGTKSLFIRAWFDVGVMTRARFVVWTMAVNDGGHRMGS